MSAFVFLLLQFSILAYAIVAGVFLAFSDFIMRALARTGGVGGVEAMQVINREVFRWIFIALFLGMAALSVFILIYGALVLAGGPRTLVMLGALTYLLGCFAVTIICNVPMNEALAKMKLSDQATHDYWTRTYLPRWTAWNTVRTTACALAAALMLSGLVWLVEAQPQLV